MKHNNKRNKTMLNATLLLDDKSISLSSREKRKNEYLKDAKQKNIELLTVSS